MRTLTIIAPVFEEAASIRAFYTRLRSMLARISDRYCATLVFVCDPGRDETESILTELAASDPSLQVICFSRRFGHQMALLAGLDHARGDAVVMMDSDLQHPPEVIPQLLENFEAGYEIVMTVRRYAPDTSRFKRWSSHLFYYLLGSISDTPIVENAADFRLISRRVCRLFQDRIRERNQFLRGLISWVGFRQATVAFDAPDRAAGSTKYNLPRMIHFAIAGIVSFSKKPLYFSIVFGLIVALAGFIMAIWTVILYVSGSSFPAGWVTLLASICILGGVQLIFLGVLGEYIASIFDETKARPLYIIDYALNLDD